MKKLGLDLGSSSIGWAIRENNGITFNGVITFQGGMKNVKGNYTSPTKDRRSTRSKRRLIQARKYRKWELLEVLLNEYVPLTKPELDNWSKYKKGEVQKFPENVNFLKWLACDFTYEDGIKYKNPYELRVKALDEKLSKHEFGRALYHLVQRRGYKNIGESDSEEFDVNLANKDVKTKTQIERREKEGFANALNNNRTIAEALTKVFLDKGERARNQYPLRREYRNELEVICKGQGYDISKTEKGDYKNEFVQKLYNAIIWQRPLRSQKGNIGKCTLEPNKPRCPVSHPIFEIFRAWSFINTIKCADDDKKEKEFLTPEIRENLFNVFFLKQDGNFKFEKIREYLDKEYKSKKTYNYPFDKKENKYDSSVSGMPVCKGLIKIFGEKIKDCIINIHKYIDIDDVKIKSKYEKIVSIKSKEKLLEEKELTNIKEALSNDFINNVPKIVNNYSLFDLWHILFEFEEKHLEKFAIEKLKIENETNKNGKSTNPFAKLKGTITQGYSDLSLKAMIKIIPFLKEGFLYNEAVVLAKMPELLGDKWEEQKEVIKLCIKKSNAIYKQNKITVNITNSLIDQYKGAIEQWREQGTPLKAWNDFTYVINQDDINEIEKGCKDTFGEISWKNKTDKEQLIEGVKYQYQLFFKDTKRAYREVPLLTDILKAMLKEYNIEVNGNLYHHSNRKNLYLKKNEKLPIDNKTGFELLPTPLIDSIKNPMFNKSLAILRKLVNELIRTNKVGNDTEVVVEVASELNDNNKRAAIEKYQNERKNNRERYRQFLTEFKENKNSSLNVEERIATFEMWTEQTFEETENEKQEKIKNRPNSEIHKEKNALKRYELWMEQKGQCMYTGKMISISQLFSNEIDIAHTIPRSLLPDNTMANMTVAYARYNRDFQTTKTPFYCDNYSEDKPIGTAIVPRLEKWIKLRDKWKQDYEKNIKPKGNEDENTKNERIINKHYFKMHYDYWKDKVERFEAKEVKDGWARRQLVDTQMVSKYAREYLKTYFKKVAVQKGSVTAEFRKIYGFQEQDEIKGRNKHTHHAIDAAVLTLIPTNSSYRDKIIKEWSTSLENKKKSNNRKPFEGFNSQTLINDIENKTLIVNFEKDTILKQTSKIVRKRGRIQYVKNKKGEFIVDTNGKKIIKKAQGDTVRSSLYKDTFVAKIKDVERFEDGQPKRENGDWKYKKGKDEFIFVKRENIDKVKANDNLIGEIVDRNIRELVNEQKNNSIIKDFNGKIIRHVRIYTSAGRKVKERVNYKSKHDYKNKYYAAADSLPYAIMLQKTNDEKKIERVMIPIASFEIAKFYKETRSFSVTDLISKKYSKYNEFPDKKLLKVGQKVIVLKIDAEFEKRFELTFQTNRLYVIKKFGEDSIYLKYHLEATKDDDIDAQVKLKKDEIIAAYDKKFGLPEIKEDETIVNINVRKKKYEDDRFKFVGLNDTRFKRLSPFMTKEELNELRKEIGKYKKQNTKIEIDGSTPLLKINKGVGWNFLYEGIDFKISLLGQINWLNK